MLTQTHKIVEALLFSAREPLTTAQVELCLEESVALADLVNDLNEYYEEQKSPILIQELAEGYRLVTRSEYDPWVRRLYQERGQMKLSRSALETLSIVAYKQPVTRTDVDAIRGVSTSLKTLLEKNLIRVSGRLDRPGRPLLYATTSYFLEYFGLNSIKDLPNIKELEEIFDKDDGESRDEGDSSEQISLDMRDGLAEEV